MCTPICKTSTAIDTDYTLYLSGAIDEIRQDIWDKVVDDKHFYAKSDHLEIVERTSAGKMKPFYLMVQKGGQTKAVLYFQQLTFSFENALSNFKWEKPYWKSLFTWITIHILSRLNIPLIQSGNIFFTGDSGIYFKDDVDMDARLDILQFVNNHPEWQQFLHKHASASMWGNLFQTVQLGGMKENGYELLETEPDLWMPFAQNWTTFSDYLNDLSSKYRVRAKKVVQLSQHLTERQLSLEDVIRHETRLLELYHQVAAQAAFNLAYLQKGYFSELKALYLDDLQVVAYFDGEELVAFTSAIFHGQIGHAHYMGMDYAKTKDLHLYNRMLLDYIREGIHKRCRYMHFGRTATEIKTTIGAQPISMHGYLRLENPFLNRFLPILLNNYGSGKYIQRHPFREPQQQAAPILCSLNNTEQ